MNCDYLLVCSAIPHRRRILLGMSVLSWKPLKSSLPAPMANTGTKSPEWPEVVQPMLVLWSSTENVFDTN